MMYNTRRSFAKTFSLVPENLVKQGIKILKENLNGTRDFPVSPECEFDVPYEWLVLVHHFISQDKGEARF